MKLKKIASLALAGVMAVSMLAGCAGKGTTTTEPVKTESTPAVVAAVNNGQSANNDVKVTFTYSTELENAVKTLIANAGDGAVTIDTTNVSKVTGKTYVASSVNTNKPLWGTNAASTTAASAEGTQTVLYAGKLDALTEDAALKLTAANVQTEVAKLVSTSYDKENPTNAYYNFDNKGEVALVSATSTTGTTSWYYVFTITQTAAKKQMEK